MFFFRKNVEVFYRIINIKAPASAGAFMLYNKQFIITMYLDIHNLKREL